jgi:hypothetical protein
MIPTTNVNQYVDSLQDRVFRAEAERDAAVAESQRLKRLYEEDIDGIIRAKLLKCELAERKDEISRLKQEITELERQLSGFKKDSE